MNCTKHSKRSTANRMLRIAQRQFKSFLTAVVTPSHQSTSKPKPSGMKKAKALKEKSPSLNSIMLCSKKWKEAVPLVLMVLLSIGWERSGVVSNWWHSMPSMSATEMDLSALLLTLLLFGGSSGPECQKTAYCEKFIKPKMLDFW